MKIQSIHNQSFKGYDARPLNAIYMQKSAIQGSYAIYNELHDIGREVGFDVIMNAPQFRLLSTPEELKYAVRTANYGNCWAQDNKVFINKDGAVTILYPDKTNNNILNVEAKELAQKLGINCALSKCHFEGGNIFLGIKDNGEKYLLMGADTISENLGARLETEEDMTEYVRNYIKPTRAKNNPKTIKREINDIIDDFSKDFDIKKDNIFIIRQPSFHLDMTIRPLKYPYVLVNDIKETDKVAKNFKGDKSILNNYRDYQIANVLLNYESGDKIADDLEKNGFKPIRVPGVFGRNINFMNAIVHEKKDGSLCYITNSCECANEDYMYFQKAFEKSLKKTCKDIDDIRFVSGGRSLKPDNNIMTLLGWLYGGIHCMTAEEPKFDISA